VQNRLNKVAVVELNSRFTSGEVVDEPAEYWITAIPRT
jgi:hypothetical protein